MTDTIAIAVTGASGRMGQMLIHAVLNSPEANLISAVVRPGHDWVGQDLGIAMGDTKLGVEVTDDPVQAFVNAQAVLDFTAPDATVGYAEIAAQARVVHVIGTTGFTEGNLTRLEAASHHAVIVRAGNMSLGVNLLARMTTLVTQALGEAFDIEIVEAHHSQKADAPSGTALMLGEAAAKARGVALGDVATRGRDGITGPRKNGSIGFSSIRGGDIVGEHDVMFAGAGERIILRHVATDRNLFAKGALRAAIWGQGKKPGEYDMFDVLGL